MNNLFATQLMQFIRSITRKNYNFSRIILLSTIFYVAAAASTGGFLGKWGFRDGAVRFGIEQVLNETATKPFLFRRLAPLLVNTLEKITPEKIKISVTERIKLSKTFTKTTLSENKEISFRYIALSYLCLLATFIYITYLYKIIKICGGTSTTATLLAVVFALFFPYIQTQGGYYYDSIELVFLTTAVYYSITGNLFILTIIAGLGTLNKETFFFFIPTLFPFIRINYNKIKTIAHILISIIIASAINIWLKLQYISAAGEAAEIHIIDNIYAIFEKSTYLTFETTYGFAGPAGLSIISMIILFIIFSNGWKLSHKRIKHHVAISLFINVPLFIAFANTGELRNLSFLFIGIMLMCSSILDNDKINSGRVHLDKNNIART